MEMDHIFHDIKSFPIIASWLLSYDDLSCQDRQRPSDNFNETGKSFDLFLQIYHNFFVWSVLLLIYEELVYGLYGQWCVAVELAIYEKIDDALKGPNWLKSETYLNDPLDLLLCYEMVTSYLA